MYLKPSLFYEVILMGNTTARMILENACFCGHPNGCAMRSLDTPCPIRGAWILPVLWEESGYSLSYERSLDTPCPMRGAWIKVWIPDLKTFITTKLYHRALNYGISTVGSPPSARATKLYKYIFFQLIELITISLSYTFWWRQKYFSLLNFLDNFADSPSILKR